MSRRQLFLYSLVMIIVTGNGVGMATMLPVYLHRIGADSSFIGFFFSMLYLALSSAGIMAGWISDRYQNRKLLCVASAAIQIPVSVLLLITRSLPLLSAVIIFSWFLAGIHMAMIYVLIGLQAKENERGRIFGIFGFVLGVGPIISGFLYGPLMDAYGFEILFVISLVISVVWTALSLFFVDVRVDQPSNDPKAPTKGPALGIAFFLLAFASMLGWTTINGGKLGISMVMSGLEFSAADISTSAAVASLVSLCIPLLLGWLSDFTGRKILMLGLNLLGLISLLILSQTQGLYGFWIASALLSLYSCFSGLCNALVTDLVPPQSLGLALSIISNTSNIAGIFSSALLGLALTSFGAQPTFLIALILPVATTLMLVFVHEKKRRSGTSQPEPAPLYLTQPGQD